MIENLNKPFSDNENLSVLNKYVREWFVANFGELTPPQKFTFKLIHERESVLVTAPTGSGKTMSGFLSVISALFDYSIKGKLEDGVYCIYVSPLRSLNNDIYRNLLKPLDEIYDMIIKDKGLDIIKSNIKKVSVGVRTGDTTQQERRKQLLKPPNILITTPESLAIMINSKKFVEHLKSCEFIIIDEIHELASNKRGVHLSLTVERLTEIIGRNVARIGLGATIHPIEEAAKFLVGYENGEPRNCKIVDATWSKKLEVVAMSPVNDLIYAENAKIEDELYKQIDAVIKSNRATLIFTNTRSGTERVIFNLKKRFGYGEDIAAHHSSLSREARMDVEELLKKGSLKCAVTSTSLELGVDIGSIDNVVQLGSPKSVTRAIQRIGRAGHSYKAIAKGEVMALDRDDLVECSVMLDAAMKRHLDSFEIPKNSLDVLAQHIVGMAITDNWDVDKAYKLVTKAYPYSTLDRNDFMSLLDYLAGNYVGLESRNVYSKIVYNKEENKFGKRGGLSQLIYMLNLGTIPDEVTIGVFTTKNKWIGNIEEEFLTKLKPGDIFALGGRLYEFQYAKEMKCYVVEAKSNTPTIPPWFSEQLPLSYELANEISKFRGSFSAIVERNMRKAADKLIPDEVRKFLDKLPMDENAKIATYGYFYEQLVFAGAVPNEKLILIENTIDIEEQVVKKGKIMGKHFIIFHSLFGRRINDALSRAFAIELSERLDSEVGILVSDNGFVLNVADLEISKSEIDRMIKDVSGMDITAMLKQNIRRTELMKRRFRHVASRGFMILRNYKGFKVGVGKQQINSQLLLNSVEEIDQNFPLLKETYREIFYDLMDLERAQKILSEIKEGKIKYKIIKTDVPSPFSHKMITFGYADVMMMDSKHLYLQRLHKSVMERIK